MLISNNPVIYTDSVGETANVTVFLNTTTAPEVVLTVATLTGGGKQDVVVDGSYETGIESFAMVINVSYWENGKRFLLVNFRRLYKQTQIIHSGTSEQMDTIGQTILSLVERSSLSLRSNNTPKY